MACDSEKALFRNVSELFSELGASAADLSHNPLALGREAMFRRNLALAYGMRYVSETLVGACLYRDDLSHF